MAERAPLTGPLRALPVGPDRPDSRDARGAAKAPAEARINHEPGPPAMTGGPTRRVRFRAEWDEELPAEPEPGDRVAVPFRELVVREVALSWEERRDALADAQARDRPLYHDKPAGDLGGADVLAELAPSLVEPGATWRATANLSVLGTLRKGDPNWWFASSLERDAATLGDALDAFANWAEEWMALDPPLRAPHGRPPELRGHAKLSCVEPGGPDYGRTVVHCFLGTHGDSADPARVLAALEALCEEAERLYGDGRAKTNPFNPVQ